jgi:FMN phosphatase YigB (HAD superfamily)
VKRSKTSRLQSKHGLHFCPIEYFNHSDIDWTAVTSSRAGLFFAASKRVNAARTLPEKRCVSALRGLLGLLRQAKERGYRLGVLSDYPAAEKLSAMGILEYFDAVVSSDDESVGYLKPHPRGLQTCLQQLSVQPQSLYVGDRADVDLPFAACVHTQFVLFGKSPSQAGCLAVSSYLQLSHALGFQS